MPTWFQVLANVLLLVSRLIPLIEEQFGSRPGSGVSKKAAVMGPVGEMVLRSPDGGQARELSEEQREAIMVLASAAVDAIVGNANVTGVFKPQATIVPGPTVAQDERSEGGALP